MRVVLAFLALVFVAYSAIAQNNKSSANAAESHILVVKFKENNHSSPNQRAQAANQILSSTLQTVPSNYSLSAAFPQHQVLNSSYKLQGQASLGLNRIYKLEFPSAIDAQNALKELRVANSTLEYAELLPEPKLLEEVGDELEGNQHYLPIIKAAQAWATQKGSSDMVIGILDTGTDMDHPDLVNNIHTNDDEIPNNGIDDDQDGYVDNYQGWDFANNDNDPSADRNEHGVKVSGIISAVRGNGGMAGLSNNCKFMPIKIFSSHNNRFINGYEAIVYAADQGCKVINLSWGAPGSPSKYIQDIIDYATLEKDAVVIAAAGNTNVELDFYPASCSNVISVTATKGGNSSEAPDARAAWSTYSRFVDIAAPGEAIYSTANNGKYKQDGGTSYSSPMVAATAALIRLKYPELNALQVMEIIRQSADDFSQIAENLNYEFRIGKGRLNMENALLGIQKPSVRVSEYNYTSEIEGFIMRGELIELNLKLTNYLAPISAFNVNVVSESDYAQVVSYQAKVGGLNTLETTENPLVYTLQVSEDIPANHPISIRVEVTNGTYTDYEYIEIYSGSDYLNVQADKFKLTLGANGNLGYNMDYNLQGLGLHLNEAKIADQIGLLVSAGNGTLASNVFHTSVPNQRDKDFTYARGLKIYGQTDTSDVRSAFKISPEANTGLNLLFEQQLLGWNTNEESSSAILEYRIFNQADTAYTNISLGLFTDFNIGTSTQNRTAWNNELALGYTYTHSEDNYMGVLILGEGSPLFSGINLADHNGNIADIAGKFSKAQKLQWLAKETTLTIAGSAGNGNDVAQLSGLRLPTLSAGAEGRVAFGLVYAASLEELEATAINLRERYLQYLQNLPIMYESELCGPTKNLQIDLGDGVYKLWPEATSSIQRINHQLTVNIQKDTSIYLQRYNGLYYDEPEQVLVNISPIEASFIGIYSTLELENNLVSVPLSIRTTATDSIAWLVNGTFVGNGLSQTLQLIEAGTYQVSAICYNKLGCNTTLSQLITVEPEPFAPEVRFYPNPATDILTVELTEEFASNSIISLTTLQGVEILKQFSSGQSANSIKLHNLKTGYYILNVISPTEVFRSKILKK
jgi:subtilisin family serine protease